MTFNIVVLLFKSLQHFLNNEWVHNIFIDEIEYLQNIMQHNIYLDTMSVYVCYGKKVQKKC